MLSFYNDIKIKDKYIARVKAHQDADEIVKGQYWQGGKGCAVGCTLHSSDHSAYEAELGLPEWLALLEDYIFEGVTNEYAKTFPLRFLEAIPVGVDMEPIRWHFCLFILKGNIKRVKNLDISDEIKKQVIDGIQSCAEIHKNAIKTGVWDNSAALSAALSARSAAESARSAAESAAESAWSAALSAARSADESAWSATWSSTYEIYAEKLLELLKLAK